MNNSELFSKYSKHSVLILVMHKNSVSRNKEVFTVSPDLIPLNQALPFNLFINSSTRKNTEHFICIWKKNRRLNPRELYKIQKKFGHIYILENERSLFFESIGNQSNMSAEAKVGFLKAAATEYLQTIFFSNQLDLNTKFLNESLKNSKSAVSALLKSLKNFDIFGLNELIAKLDFHDHYTLDHSINTALYNMMLYRELKPNTTDNELVMAGLCGMFHDIGKIHLPNSIINATQELSENQYTEIKKHPAWGKELLAREGIDFNKAHLSVISAVVYEHHENYNGTGYPNKLLGEDINIFARMTAISDFFDAITTKRSYHEPVDPITALGIIDKSCGKKIDPTLFKLFKNKILGDNNLDHGLALPDDFDPCMPHFDLPISFEDEIPKTLEEQAGPEDIIHYTWTHKHQ